MKFKPPCSVGPCLKEQVGQNLLNLSYSESQFPFSKHVQVVLPCWKLVYLIYLTPHECKVCLHRQAEHLKTQSGITVIVSEQLRKTHYGQQG